MRIDPADLAESIGTLADLDLDRGPRPMEWWN